MGEKRCEGCRYFYPMYHQVGRCTRFEGTNMNAKLFTDDAKARILVHISFGCVQWETPLASSAEVL